MWSCFVGFLSFWYLWWSQFHLFDKLKYFSTYMSFPLIHVLILVLFSWSCFLPFYYSHISAGFCFSLPLKFHSVTIHGKFNKRGFSSAKVLLLQKGLCCSCSELPDNCLASFINEILLCEICRHEICRHVKFQLTFSLFTRIKISGIFHPLSRMFLVHQCLLPSDIYTVIWIIEFIYIVR